MADIDILKIARLARLDLSVEELRAFEAQLPRILEFIEGLKQVPVEGVEPTSHPLSLSNVFREDAVKPVFSAAPVLEHAPSSRGPFFLVPKVIEDRS